MCRRASSPCPNLLQVLPPGLSLRGELSPGKSHFSLDTGQVLERFGSSEAAGKGREEQTGRAGCQHPHLVASWPKELCVWWAPWWAPRSFTPPVPRVPKTPKFPSRDPPAEPREPSLSTIPIPGRAELSGSISMLGIRVFNAKLHLLANGKAKCHFFSKIKITAFKSPSNGLEKGNGAITQLLLDPKSISAPGNSCNILINPSKPASVHKQPASNRGSVTFESGSLSEV